MGSTSTSLEEEFKLPAYELSQRISDGHVTSEAIVQESLRRIEAGKHLNAIISACPENIALKRARELDDELKNGKRRSAFHGIPIVVKDCIATSPELGMRTTAGSPVIDVMKAKGNAALVERLLNAGLIIVGKGNLTEFCGLKHHTTPLGYSTCGGQTLSPFRRKDLAEEDQPEASGSSSGPAVSVTAGFVPLAIGTETSGSLVFPAAANGLYGITLSHGSVPAEGVWCISERFDRIGPLARNVKDLELLAEILQQQPGNKVSQSSKKISAKNEREEEVSKWSDIRVGITKPTWGIHESQKNSIAKFTEVTEEWTKSVEHLKTLGAKVVSPIEIPDALEGLKHKDNGLYHVALYECKHKTSQAFLSFFENDGVKDISDMIEWNKANSEIAMPDHHPGQDQLEATRDIPLSAEQYEEAVCEISKKAGPEGLGKIMDENGVDLIISNSECYLMFYSAWMGAPIASIPPGWKWSKNGQPMGWHVAARKGKEEDIYRFMRLFGELEQKIE